MYGVKMFRSLIHFDMLLRVGRYTHCLAVGSGRSWNLIGVKRAIGISKLRPFMY